MKLCTDGNLSEDVNEFRDIFILHFGLTKRHMETILLHIPSIANLNHCVAHFLSL